ncbi:MAG: DUF1275 domain-containing protein [Oscillospiraceae bacterium]|nr:DUF1275 domain-containing protein [Oscillospiraceae bacterium]
MTERFKLLHTPGESYFVTGLLMWTGGFLEAYTYLLKGGVFANAQTGNLALLGLALAEQNWMQAIDCLIPVMAYIVGIWLTLHMPRRLQKGLRWETLFMLVEILVLFAVGCLPASVPFGVSTVAVSFLCAMQYNTFTKAHGIPMATTFCTNNLRQAVIHFYKAKHHEKGAARKAWFFVRHLLWFVAGALIGGILCGIMAERAVWINAAVLIPAAGIMVYADVRKSARLERKNIQ